MNEIGYVSAQAVDLAKSWEQRFISLQPAAGVLFVGIRPVPASGGVVKEFLICIGLRKNIPEDTGLALGRHVLQDQLQNYRLTFQVFRGIPGAASPAKAGEDPN